MNRIMLLAVFLSITATPLLADSWENVPLIDTMCLSKVKDDPDSHTRSCLMSCAKSGFGVLTQDGTYLKLDEAGNQKAEAALKASDKSDHIRVTVTGERQGDTLKVQSLKLD
ncbi:MAG: hypothetical protein ACE15E_17630 [Acidobacteriota bacterium]